METGQCLYRCCWTVSESHSGPNWTQSLCLHSSVYFVSLLILHSGSVGSVGSVRSWSLSLLPRVGGMGVEVGDNSNVHQTVSVSADFHTASYDSVISSQSLRSGQLLSSSGCDASFRIRGTFDLELRHPVVIVPSLS